MVPHAQHEIAQKLAAERAAAEERARAEMSKFKGKPLHERVCVMPICHFTVGLARMHPGRCSRSNAALQVDIKGTLSPSLCAAN